MSGKILILTALPDELDKARAPGDVEVIYTGVGKINAATATTVALLALRPSLVINFGTAGKINPALSGLHEITEVVQRDMMAMPLAPRGRTPYSPELDRLAAAIGSATTAKVTCGTGDSFVTATDPWLVENAIDLVDMELFGVAHVCQRHGVPWRSFKFITDDANDFAADHWTANVANGETLFWEALTLVPR